MKHISITLLLLFFLLNVAHRTNANETDCIQENFEPDKPLFDDIRDLAARMEVFPVDLYASNGTGPLGAFTVFEKLIPDWRTSHSAFGWKDRYELTFDRYIPMYEFKERIYRASAEEIDDCINRIDEMTTKEKALLFTGIYIYENHWRLTHYIMYCMLNIMKREINFRGSLITHKHGNRIEKRIYDRWFAVIEKYKEDTTIAFPAIYTPLEELKKEWEINYEKYDQVTMAMMEKWNLPEKSNIYHSGNDKVLESIKTESPQEARLFLILAEYHCIFDLARLRPTYSGNSSAFPKTLGDIATQILMSRDSYDDRTPY